MRTNRALWDFVFVSVVFTLAGLSGLFLAHGSHDLIIGITYILFFALSGFSIFHRLVVRRQNQLFWEAPPKTLPKDAVFPMKRGQSFLLGTTILVLGILIILSGEYTPNKALIWCGVVMVVGAGLLVLLILTGLVGSLYLRFEKNGLRYGDRNGSFLVEWKNIQKVLPEEYFGNQCIWLQFRNKELLLKTVEGKSRFWKEKWISKGLKTTGVLMGCDYFIMTEMFGLNAVVLAQNIADRVKRTDVQRALDQQIKNLLQKYKSESFSGFVPRKMKS